MLLFQYWTPPVGSPPVTAFPRVAHYRPWIVWGTGTPVDTMPYDDVRGYYLNQPGLQIDGIGRDQARAYAPPAAASFDLTLTNWDGRFSPGGPIGTFVGRGPRTTLDIDWGDDYGCVDNGIKVDDPYVLVNGIETSRIFEGTVNTAQHTLTRPQRSLQIRALGMFSSLLDKRPVTTQLYEGIKTSAAITHLLDLVGWPTDMRAIDEGDTTLLFWWLDGSQTALAVLNQILEAEGAGGCAYEQAGVFHFEGRQFRANNPRSVEAQWIFSDGFFPNPDVDDSLTLVNADTVLVNGLTPGQVLIDVNPSETQSNPDEVVSAVTASINQRSPTTVIKVWELGRPLVLPDATPVDTIGPTQDLYRGAVTPVNAADVAPTAVSDFTVAAGTLASVQLLSTSGHQVRIRWTAGAGGAVINGTTSNGPQLRAVSLPVVSEIAVRSTTNTALEALRYSPREHDLGAWPEVAFNQMLDVVNSMCLRYRTERRQAQIRIVNLDGRHMQMIMHARISDRIVWIQRHGGLNDPYWIEQIHHDISPGGGLHTMILGCERVYDPVGSRFDIGLFDTTGRFGD